MPDLRVLLLGDALRLSYQSRVKAILAEDGFSLAGPAASTGGSHACREGAESWLNTYRPDLVSFSAPPHAAEDAHLLTEGSGGLEPVSFSDYEDDILHLGELFRRACGRQVVFVTTPRVHVERFAATQARSGSVGISAGRDLAESLNRGIEQYNEVAFTILSQLNIMVTRLCEGLAPHADECMGDDGVRLTPNGVERAARIVACGVLAVV